MSRQQLQDSEAVSDLPEKAILATVFNYLKNKNLKETEEALKKELSGFGAVNTSTPEGMQFSSIGHSGTEPLKYEDAYSGLSEIIEKSLDIHRSELTQLLYPVFVHIYIDLILTGHTHQGQQFFSHFHGQQESFYDEELLRFKSVTTPEQMVKHELFETFRKNKFTVRISNDSFQGFVKQLQMGQNTIILNIISRYLNLDLFDGVPRARIDIMGNLGALEGEAATKANKAKLQLGIPRDPDLAQFVAQMEEEENENNEDEKPKKKKIKKDTGLFAGKKGKLTTIPNAPPLNRIPLPKLRECEQNAKYQAFKESAKCVSLGPRNLPSICFYTLMNTHGSLTAVCISDDASLMSGSFSDSIVRVWTLTPKKLCPLRSAAQMQRVPLTAEDVAERIIDTTSSAEMRMLTGHSGPVFSTSFNPDLTFLLSSSEDGTVRLWSLQTFTCLVCYKGHNYPVWDVQFGPYGFYFASCSYDRTARVWSTDHVQPVRIFAGHFSDVQVVKFHPNGNYVATGSCDRSVRLWDLSSGQCIRILTGHKASVHALEFSPDGKYLVSSGVDKKLIVWDLSSGSHLCDLPGHTDTVYQLAFSRDGNVLASGGLDHCVKLWDATVFEEIGKTFGQGKCLLGTYMTKCTSIHQLLFTRRNLLLAAGPYQQ